MVLDVIETFLGGGEEEEPESAGVTLLLGGRQSQSDWLTAPPRITLGR